MLCRSDTGRGLRTRARFTVVMKIDDEDALARAMFRDFQRVDDRRETTAPCKRRRDVVEPGFVDSIDDNCAGTERIPATDLDMWALPDAYGARDLAAAYALVKARLEQQRDRDS